MHRSVPDEYKPVIFKEKPGMPDAREERPVGFHHESGHDRLVSTRVKELIHLHSTPSAWILDVSVYCFEPSTEKKKYILLDRFDSLNRMIASLCSN